MWLENIIAGSSKEINGEDKYIKSNEL